MSQDEKDLQYKVDIGIRHDDGLTAILCKDGVGKLFADVVSEKEFVSFYCCAGDKTLLRVSEITFLISKVIQLGVGK